MCLFTSSGPGPGGGESEEPTLHPTDQPLLDADGRGQGALAVVGRHHSEKHAEELG